MSDAVLADTAAIVLNRGSLALGIGGAVLAFDLEGRLYSAFVEGKTFVRGLSGRVLEKRRGADGARARRECAADERVALYAAVRELGEAVLDAHVRGGARVVGDRARATLLVQRVLSWSPDRLEHERVRFAAVYGTVGILPPDQYLAVLLQAADGCAWNRCTFCGFYRGRRYRVRSVADFRAHVRAVRDLLGDGLRLRRSVFLGDAAALGVPLPRLVEFLDVTAGELPELREVHAFMEIGAARKSRGDLRRLAEHGLTRVTVGLETGCDELRRFVLKPGTAADAVDAVSDLKAAGLRVGVVVMLGLGGDRYAERHVADTTRALRAMPLGAGDIVYFSPLVEMSACEYAERARAAAMTSLDAAQLRAQETAIRERLAVSGGPTLARYAVEEFVY